MFGLSGWEIPLIVLLALLFFGGKKLPELAKGFGKSIRTFKDEVKKEDDDETEVAEAEEVKSSPKKTAKKPTSKKTSKKKSA